ncbi:hypothetical protein J9303_00450 [Bacillaceae bacterium Marseille-Q3522]|nr:hypothetical protein [Bacillaceae bacterium Marseille-Q3522]
MPDYENLDRKKYRVDEGDESCWYEKDPEIEKMTLEELEEEIAKELEKLPKI